MTTIVAPASETEADITWREWQARGEEADRQRATTMGRLIILVSIGLATVLLVQLI
jgi:hypothetical protein